MKNKKLKKFLFIVSLSLLLTACGKKEVEEAQTGEDLVEVSTEIETVSAEEAATEKVSTESIKEEPKEEVKHEIISDGTYKIKYEDGNKATIKIEGQTVTFKDVNFDNAYNTMAEFLFAQTNGVDAINAMSSEEKDIQIESSFNLLTNDKAFKNNKTYKFVYDETTKNMIVSANKNDGDSHGLSLNLNYDGENKTLMLYGDVFEK